MRIPVLYSYASTVQLILDREYKRKIQLGFGVSVSSTRDWTTAVTCTPTAGSSFVKYTSILRPHRIADRELTILAQPPRVLTAVSVDLPIHDYSIV